MRAKWPKEEKKGSQSDASRERLRTLLYVVVCKQTTKVFSISTTSQQSAYIQVMADMDVFAAMGISGFGKATKKKQLDPSRFDKNKRETEVRELLCVAKYLMNGSL